MILFPKFQGFVRIFVLACVGVFVLQQFALFAPGSSGSLYKELIHFFGLSPQMVFQGMIFQPVTWMFLHANLMHLLFNMLGLWMFGSLLEETFGAKGMLKFTLLSGVLTGLIVCVIGLFDSATFTTPTIGASGVVFATLMAISRLYPNQIVLFFFVFPMRMRYFAYLMILFEFYALYTSNASGVSNIAHLGGALIGFFYVSFTGPQKRSNRGTHGGISGWIQQLRDRWHQRKMRRRIRIIRTTDREDRTTYH